MFQWKFNEVFKELPNFFAIADDMLMVGYNTDARHHNRAQLTKKNYDHFRHNEFLRKMFTINQRGIWTTQKISLSKHWIGME